MLVLDALSYSLVRVMGVFVKHFLVTSVGLRPYQYKADVYVANCAGDYHYADLRSVDPYANALYSIPLQASKLSKPIYQVYF